MSENLKLRALGAAAVLSFLPALTTPAMATTIADPVGDFLPTYTGPLGGDLDVTSLSVTFNGSSFLVTTVLNAAVGTTPGAFYIYGVNRGTGTAGFASLGLNNVLFDTVVRVNQDGSVSSPGGLFPAIAGGASFVGNTITFALAASNLPSTGFLASNYGWNLWPRSATTAAGAPVSGTPAISDFAPNNATIAAAPEPGVWALMLSGFAVLAGALRRSRGRASKALA